MEATALSAAGRLCGEREVASLFGAGADWPNAQLSAFTPPDFGRIEPAGLSGGFIMGRRGARRVWRQTAHLDREGGRIRLNNRAGADGLSGSGSCCLRRSAVAV